MPRLGRRSGARTGQVQVALAGATRSGSKVLVKMVAVRSTLTPTDFEVREGDEVTIALTNIEQTTDEQWANSIKSKGMGQINLVRAALPFIADKGSFTLVSGVLTDEYMHGGTIGLPRGLRINCVSPTVLAESVQYHAYFTGFIPVPVWEVGQAYLRAMSTPITGRILKLHKTDC